MPRVVGMKSQAKFQSALGSFLKAFVPHHHQHGVLILMVSCLTWAAMFNNIQTQSIIIM